MKYRKKPVVIEAIQWFPDSGIHHPGVWCDPDGADANRPYVITIHNERAHLTPGDWIIPEPKAGHYYPCKPDIFEDSYDVVIDRSVNPTIENNFKYHSPKPGQPEIYTEIREQAKELAYLIDNLCPKSREQSLAMTNLEQAVMWANAGVARN